VPYFGYAMLTRFTAKHSEVLSCQVQTQTPPASKGRILAAALRSPRGNLTAIVLNEMEQEAGVQLSLLGLPAGSTKLQRYQITEASLAQAGFALAPQGEFAVSAANAGFQDRLPARSITTYSTYRLSADAPGVIAE